MATSNIQYCTHRDIKDTFPRINEFDTKRTIYGWESLGNNVYISHDTGLATKLFQDGKELHDASVAGTGTHYKAKITHNLQSVPTGINTTYNTFTYNASFTTGSESDMQVGDYIKITKTAAGSDIYEYCFIESINTGANQITVRRGTLNTGAVGWLVTGDDLFFQDAIRVNVSDQWFYDAYLDQVLLYSTTDPSDLLIESGDDFATIMTRFAKRASRMIDSKIGYRVTDTQIKDREGNYPDIIVRAAALQSVILLLTSEDPTNPIIEPFKEELAEIVDGINSGTIVILGNQRTMDAAKGIIREVSVNASSDLRPVELTGHYTGSAYELLKVYIDSGENGVIGTTRMTVKGKDSTKLKNTVLIDSEIITGDYQSLGLSDMKIRWSGDNDSAVTTADDEYEIEVFGHNLDSSTPGQVGNIKMTRR